MRFATTAILIATAWMSGFGRQQQVQPTLPASDAGKHVAAYLEAFNSSNENAMRRFFLVHGAKDALQQVRKTKGVSSRRLSKRKIQMRIVVTSL
jgi:hypothetical protein